MQDAWKGPKLWWPSLSSSSTLEPGSLCSWAKSHPLGGREGQSDSQPTSVTALGTRHSHSHGGEWALSPNEDACHHGRSRKRCHPPGVTRFKQGRLDLSPSPGQWDNYPENISSSERGRDERGLRSTHLKLSSSNGVHSIETREDMSMASSR